MLCDIMRVTYRTEGKLDLLAQRVAKLENLPISNAARLDLIAGQVQRMEDREHSRGTTGHREPRQTWSPRDYLLTAAGIALVTAAALDKVPWSVVQQFASALE